jgi:NACHT domain
VTRKLPRWLGLVGACALVALAIGLALSGVPRAITNEGDVFANLGKNLLTAAVLGVIAYLWFYSWTSQRATRQLRDLAARRPELLFPIRPRIGMASQVVGRQDLIDDVTSSLRLGAGPLVIVGETGAGKTSFLLGLARHFAQELDVLPIVLSLRNASEIDFADLAYNQFGDYIDPHVRTKDEAEKLWRWLCRRGKIVILADDLDRATLPGQTSDPHRTTARLALAAARSRELPLVVASRPQGVPADLEEPAMELGSLELSPEEAAQHVLARAGRRDDEKAKKRALAHITNGDLRDNAFYLGVLARLLRNDVLPAPSEARGHAVRVALLDAWRASLLGDRTVTPEEKMRREACLECLERFAAARLVPEPPAEGGPGHDPDWAKPEQALKDAGLEAGAVSDRQWADALHLGLRLQVMEVSEDDGGLRFAHDVLHAYFASKVLRHDPDACRSAIRRAPDAARVQLALVLGAASGHDPVFCRAACEELISGGADVPDEQRLLRASAAAEVASAGEFRELDDRIAEECAAARGDATAVAKGAAVEQLRHLAGERAIEALWEYTRDYEYFVRWAAAKALIARCSQDTSRPAALGVRVAGTHAYDVIARHIDANLAQAEPCCELPDERRPDDWDAEVLPLKQMAWILPALRTSTAESNNRELAARVAGHLEKLLNLEARKVTRQRGLEASIAQGFKVDAFLNRDAAVADEALKLLRRDDVFWYTQINLLHAIALRTKPGDAGRVTRETLGRFAALAEHPLVKSSAWLCLEGLDAAAEGEPDAVDHYVWDDEGVVVSGRPRDLHPDAIQLVGDITVLLNLNETGSLMQRESFGGEKRTPYCMSTSRNRMELFDDQLGCHDCDFNLCPYRPTPGMSARREISRAFCRHQALHARARTAKKWGSHVKQSALSEFWRRYESEIRL